MQTINSIPHINTNQTQYLYFYNHYFELWLNVEKLFLRKFSEKCSYLISESGVLIKAALYGLCALL